MSLLPFVNDAFARAFGYPEQFFPTLYQPNTFDRNLWPGIYQRRLSGPQQNELSGQATIGKDGFQVCMDVQHFQPNEITVKTVGDSVVIEGEHEEKEDEHGHIYRHFTRRYQLPKQFDVKDVVSSLSSDGVLTIKAPPKPQAIGSNERVIQIQQTGPAHLTVKPNKEKEKEKEKVKKVGQKMSK